MVPASNTRARATTSTPVGASFLRALGESTRRYAEQTEQEHQRLADAVARGAVPGERGV
ncbi:hypothetical protein O2W15_10135 [Modestobacter sp. VKM Ac-2979]|uniref:hypothetical protein n=1 Tax=unclassified Modestobacter TaxID=2643866 RepID=UPI0022AB9C3C|nr:MULTISPECIES: hypothetical protein [unclassified Modestobacter]MCZ2811796.1 hypothetical protein [Modestobacter sp. VKM Ac-2979]MCZ2843519.1 hypothetical protein [Modestobacter sp. VKM Ac-2980]